MITIDELKVQLADYAKAVKDLEEALAIEASRKRVQELEHTMSRPGFYDDADLSKKVFDEVGDLKGKLSRFEKLQGLYDDAETMLVMLDEEYDPEMVPEAEEAVNAVGKAVDELQLMTMLNGEYDHSNAILTFHAGTGGTEAQDWAEMLYRMYNKWAQAHGMTVEVLDYQDGDEAGMTGGTDPYNRGSFPWGKGNAPLTDFVRSLTAMYQETPLLRRGKCEMVFFGENVLGCRRFDESGSVLALVNRGEEAVECFGVTVPGRGYILE